MVSITIFTGDIKRNKMLDKQNVGNDEMENSLSLSLSLSVKTVKL